MNYKCVKNCYDLKNISVFKKEFFRAPCLSRFYCIFIKLKNFKLLYIFNLADFKIVFQILISWNAMHKRIYLSQMKCIKFSVFLSFKKSTDAFLKHDFNFFYSVAMKYISNINTLNDESLICYVVRCCFLDLIDLLNSLGLSWAF